MVERKTELRKSRDKARIENTGSGTEREIKRDKERSDIDATEKRTDGHYEQSAITLLLTVKPTNTNTTPSSSDSAILCLLLPTGAHSNLFGCVKHFSIPPLHPLLSPLQHPAPGI